MAFSTWVCLFPLIWSVTDAVHLAWQSSEGYNDGETFMRVLPQPEHLKDMHPTLLKPDEKPYRLIRPDAHSYSQWMQDITLAPILRSMGKGFFVESGAQNGEAHSNTLILEKSGWSGLLVEPNPISLGVLEGKHRKAYVFEGALSPTASREVVRFSGERIREDSKKDAIDVVAEPLASLLKGLDQRTVDFWSLDIEGFEGRVLNSTDFREIEVGVLLIEVAHENDGLVEDVMLRNGFQFIGHSYYQKKAVEIKDASPEHPWLVLDAVYINPAYFKARSLPVPKRISEDLHQYDCRAATARQERGLSPRTGDNALLKACRRT